MVETVVVRRSVVRTGESRLVRPDRHARPAASARHACVNPAAEPWLNVTVVPPASAVEVVIRMAPAGVNSSVNELSGLLSTSCGPCQLPWKATTDGEDPRRQQDRGGDPVEEERPGEDEAARAARRGVGGIEGNMASAL